MSGQKSQIKMQLGLFDLKTYDIYELNGEEKPIAEELAYSPLEAIHNFIKNKKPEYGNYYPLLRGEEKAYYF